jgi:hypothetical protein
MKTYSAMLSFVVLFLAGASGGENAPKIPDKLKVPEGNVLLFKTEAKGVQIYVSKEENGELIWKFKAPLADLYQDGKKVGYHYAGPSWEGLDGSKIQIDKSAKPTPVDAPNPKTAVPWLRIKVQSAENKGKFGPVTYVLRVNTEGGVAPAQKPRRVGTEIGVPYKATYIFFGPRK